MARNFTTEERIAALVEHERRNQEREAQEAESRMDAPVSRRELLEAIDKVRSIFSGSAHEPRDLISDALTALFQELA